MNIKTFNTYQDYIDLQIEKTLDPVRRVKWANEVGIRAKIFEKTFSPYLSFLNLNGKGLCLGARTGEEVVALRNLGMKDVVGVDLVPFEDYVIEGDIHDLKFDDGSISFIYSNIFDHVLYPDLFISECFRVLHKRGIMFMQLQLGCDLDKYGVLSIDDPEEFLDICNTTNCNHNILVAEKPLYKAPNHGLNFNVILEKLL